MNRFLSLAILCAIFSLMGCGHKETSKISIPKDSTTVQETPATTTAEPVEISSEEQFYDVVNGEGLTLVDFYATWCGPCRAMHPVLEQVASEMSSDVKVIKVDVDKNSDLANKFGIQSIPTFMLFKKGDMLWNHLGMIKHNDLKDIITSRK